MATSPSYDVIFDFDGVLADSAPLIVSILDAILRVDLGLAVSDAQLRATVGPPFHQAVADLCVAAGADPDDPMVDTVVARFRAEYAERVAAETPMFPGVADALAALRADARLTICSSKPLPLVEALLEHWGARDWFAAVEAPAPGVREAKAEGLERLIGHLAADPARSALIGDTVFDARAARAHGVGFVGVTWGVGLPAELTAEGAVAIVEHPHDLPRVIGDLGAMTTWSETDDLEAILEHARDDLEALRGARAFVTGGTGFVGTWLLAALHHADRRLDLGVRPLVLTRNPTAFAARRPDLAGWAELVAGDVTEVPAIGTVDFAVHAATPASADLNDRDPDLMRSIIVDGARSVLEVLAPSGAVPLLFTSSGAVYGPQPRGMARIPEDHDPGDAAIDPRGAYALGKREAERMLMATSDTGGPSLRLARLFAFVGPGLPLDAHFAIGNFIRDALAGGPIRVAGDGTAVRSYLYAADLVAQLLAVLVRGRPSCAYNVGSDQPITIADLAYEIRDAIDPTAEVAIAGRAPDALPTGAGSRYIPATERIRAELGCTPWTGRADAIRMTAAAARASN